MHMSVVRRRFLNSHGVNADECRTDVSRKIVSVKSSQRPFLHLGFIFAWFSWIKHFFACLYHGALYSFGLLKAVVLSLVGKTKKLYRRDEDASVQTWIQRLSRMERPLGADRFGGDNRKILVLDLDETLVHSSTRASTKCDIWLEVGTDAGPGVFCVYKRPHLQEFLEKVSGWYQVCIFTASLKKYADPIIDRIDATKTIFKRRLYREDCISQESGYVKDLRRLTTNLSNIIIIDNSRAAYELQPENAIPINHWLADNDHDTGLVDLLPLLDALRHISDVRSVLSKRLRSHSR